VNNLTIYGPDQAIDVLLYNYLNLPRFIRFEDGSVIQFTYDASGRKLRKELIPGEGLEAPYQRRDYANGIEYRQDVDGIWYMESIQHSEGRVVMPLSNEQAHYEYALRDHLGNTHILFSDLDGDGKLTLFDDPNTPDEELIEAYQESHYYPFGMLMEGPFSPALDVPDNYLYNSKELRYDAAVGRFTTVDRFASDFASQSPYHYASNNPISFIDINGDSTYLVVYGSGW